MSIKMVSKREAKELNKIQAENLEIKKKRGGSRALTHEDFLNKLKEKFGEDILQEYTFLEQYKGLKKHILVRHNCEKCNYHEYPVKPAKFLQGRRCKICSYIGRGALTHEEFLNKVKTKFGEDILQEYTFLETYKNATTPIKAIHNVCNKEYYVIPGRFLSGINRCECSYKRGGALTHEDFLNKIKEKFGEDILNEYTFLEPYKDSTTPIKAIHNVCNNEYYVKPSQFLFGFNRCECSDKRKETLTHEDFLNKIIERFGEELLKEYTFLEPYKDSRTPIKTIHNVCNKEYDIIPNRFLSGNNRCECSDRRGGALTHEEFLNKLKEKFGEDILNEYTFLETYKNATTPIKTKHNVCNEEHYIIPGRFLSGINRCECCSDRVKTHEDFLNKIIEKFGEETLEEYTFLEPYQGTHKHILVRHNCEKCNYHEYPVRPSKFLLGRRCKICSYIGRGAFTHEEFLNKIKEKLGEETLNEYTFLETYKGIDTPIMVKHNCEKCNYHKYPVRPSNFLTGRRCPVCMDFKGPKKIMEYLAKNNINFEPEHEIKDCKVKRPLPFDVAVLNDNKELVLLIEFQGEQHYNYVDFFHKTDDKFVERIIYDSVKRAYCEYHNIPLLEIRYDEFDNIEEILERALKDFFRRKQ